MPSSDGAQVKQRLGSVALSLFCFCFFLHILTQYVFHHTYADMRISQHDKKTFVFRLPDLFATQSITVQLDVIKQ